MSAEKILERTDQENAQAISDLVHGHESFALRYVRDDDRWWGFRGETWQRLSIADLRELALMSGLTNARKVANAITLATGLPEMAAQLEDFDQDPYLLNTTSGTLNLRPGQYDFRGADPFDFITQVMGCAYDPNATAPRWDQFLEEILPDPDVRNYVQRLVGYALVGTQTEAILPILIGDGFNGKSTFVEIIATLFGSYAVIAEKSLFKVNKFDQHPVERMRLHKMRLAHSEELPAVELDEPKIKGLTGDDRFTGRGMGENFRTIVPSHTFLVHTNKRPIIRGTDTGIWRRVVLVPFDVKIQKQDRTVKDTLRGELPGILNWALRGLVEYQSGRFLERPQVLDSVLSEYRQESDTVSLFTNQYEPSPGAFAFGVRFDHEQHALAEGFDKAETARNYRAVTEVLSKMGGKSDVRRNPLTGKSERGWANIRKIGDKELDAVYDL